MGKKSVFQVAALFCDVDINTRSGFIAHSTPGQIQRANYEGFSLLESESFVPVKTFKGPRIKQRIAHFRKTPADLRVDRFTLSG
eukprot:scaffold189226_cov16-Tisochrysis_lutea.AAC.1